MYFKALPQILWFLSCENPKTQDFSKIIVDFYKNDCYLEGEVGPKERKLKKSCFLIMLVEGVKMWPQKPLFQKKKAQSKKGKARLKFANVLRDSKDLIWKLIRPHLFFMINLRYFVKKSDAGKRKRFVCLKILNQLQSTREAALCCVWRE